MLLALLTQFGLTSSSPSVAISCSSSLAPLRGSTSSSSSLGLHPLSLSGRDASPKKRILTPFPFSSLFCSLAKYASRPLCLPFFLSLSLSFSLSLSLSLSLSFSLSFVLPPPRRSSFFSSPPLLPLPASSCASSSPVKGWPVLPLALQLRGAPRLRGLGGFSGLFGVFALVGDPKLGFPWFSCFLIGALPAETQRGSFCFFAFLLRLFSVGVFVRLSGACFLGLPLP